jgi:aspartate/methionine/tyrosine aminotransferase
MGRKVAQRAHVAPFHVMEVLREAGEREAKGANILHLEVGQPSTPAPQAVIDKAIEVLAHDPIHYTDALGSPSLRQRIGRWYRDRYDVNVPAERVVVTTGASGACLLAFLACFDVGDRAGLAVPGYPCYRSILSAAGVEPVAVRVGAESRYQPTPQLLEQAKSLDGLVVASPSNPTGTSLDAHRLDELTSYCRDNDIWLVSDEIYHGITYESPSVTAAQFDDAAIVVNSFSKYFSMTGWRLGWLVVPPELVTPIERLAQNLTIAPPTLPQLVAEAAFDNIDELDAHVDRYARNRAILLDGLAAAGFDRIAPADGAFYVWVDVSKLTDDSEQLCRTWLDDLELAATPGVDFDAEQGHRFVRFSFAGATDDIREAVARLEEWAAAQPY